MRQIRVLHVIDSAGIYGAESMLLNLAVEQPNTNVLPIILSLGNRNSGDKAIEIEARKRGLSCMTLRMRDGLNLGGAWQILKLAQQLQADVIHSHGYKSNILLGLLPRALRSVPIITTLHGWTATKTFSKLGIYRWLDQILMRQLDGVALVNDALRQLPAFKRLRSDAIHYVPNGVPPPSVVADDDLAREIAAEKNRGSFVVGAIGRLSLEKNVSALITAVSKLAAQHPQLRVFILGDGPERENLSTLITSLGLQQHIFLKGYCAAAQRYLSLFDLFVLPSLTEGLPMVLLEAMAVATPVVATAVGGIPVLIDDSGTLVPAGDITALVTAIDAAIATPDAFAAKAKRAQQRVSAHYSAAAMARAYQNIYQPLIR